MVLNALRKRSKPSGGGWLGEDVIAVRARRLFFSNLILFPLHHNLGRWMTQIMMVDMASSITRDQQQA